MNKEWKGYQDSDRYPSLVLIVQKVQKDWETILRNVRRTAVKQLLLNSNKLIDSTSSKFRVTLAKELAPLLSKKERQITLTLPKELQRNHRRTRDLSAQTFYRLQSISTSLDIAAAALIRIIAFASETPNDGSNKYGVTKTIISQLWRKLDSI
jgi:hypothetical protein